MSQLTTFKSEGVVSCVSICETLEDIKSIVLTHEPFVLLGKGSNTVLDADCCAHVVLISPYIVPIKVSDSVVTVGAGIAVHELMTICQNSGISGFEFMAGVPASVGGMIAMNFGCWGSEVSDLVECVDVVDSQGQFFTLSASECNFSYRKSCVQEQRLAVVSVTLKGARGTPSTIRDVVKQNIQNRLSSQPLRDQTFGSVFKNPPQRYAAELLEQCGFRGYETEHIKFSEKHANFMVNKGHATFEDVVKLIAYVQKCVWEKTAIKLELEVKLLP